MVVVFVVLTRRNTAEPPKARDATEEAFAPDTSALSEETLRIRGVFDRRKEGVDSDRHAEWMVYRRLAVHERIELLARVLNKFGLHSLKGKKVLDVGCGGGSLLRHLFDFGARPETSFGIDLVPDNLQIAKHLSPSVGFALGSAARLPFSDATFDVVVQFLVFTSVLDQRLRRAIAAEILRTLRPGGFFVWYDFVYNNPRNSEVRGIGRREIRQLLPGCRTRFWRVTLVPPLGRAVSRVSPFLYRVLAQVPLLRSHYLCLAEKL